MIKTQLYNSYREYLTSDTWKEKRREMLIKYPYCKDCGDKAIHIHHKTYDHLENEPMKDLISLCLKCHCKRHNIKGY